MILVAGRRFNNHGYYVSTTSQKSIPRCRDITNFWATSMVDGVLLRGWTMIAICRTVSIFNILTIESSVRWSPDKRDRIPELKHRSRTWTLSMRLVPEHWGSPPGSRQPGDSEYQFRQLVAPRLPPLSLMLRWPDSHSRHKKDQHHSQRQ